MDMTEQLDNNSNTQKEKVTLNTSYSCPSCESGAEKYSELFDHGTCVNCGTPLSEFESTLTEKGESELKSSVVLLYDGVDSKNLADEVKGVLKENGVGVIDSNDIIKGSQTSVLSANLSYVMGVAAGTLVIPSKNLEKDVVMSTCLNNAVIQKVEKSKPLVPIYTSANIDGRVPFGLIGIAGINWDGKADSIHSSVGRDRAISHLQKMVKENSSK